MTPNVFNVDGYVVDVDVNQQLGVDLSSVQHEPDDSVTLITDQLWMTDVGKLAGLDLDAFEGAVDPRNWDACPATKSFFVSMREVPPVHSGWPKVIDETVRLRPGSPHPDVTARLKFGYRVAPAIVECDYALDPASGPEIVVDRGWVKATKFRHEVTDVSGVSGQVNFFRFRSSKTIRFADGRRLPDPILATLWGWAATRLVDCAG